MENELLVAALDYAANGWAVFPLHCPKGDGCSCGKPDCGKHAGKHPRTRNGFKSATTDEKKIRYWWRKWPDANIGLATGQLSRVVVLDEDEKDGRSGSATLGDLERKHRPVPDTLCASTGTGKHRYFLYPGGEVKTSNDKIGAGLDVRADGGYAILPPSAHRNGHTYCWTNPGTEIAQLPEWLEELMNARPSISAASNAAIIPIGQRNQALTRIAGRWRGQGWDEGSIRAELQRVNSTQTQEPLPEADVYRIAASIAKYSPGSAAPLPWFQFFPNDWFATSAVRFGDDYHRGWLIQLLAECWRRGGTLPADFEVLWKIAGASSQRAFMRQCAVVLDEFQLVQLQDGSSLLVHPWMTPHYAKALQKYQQTCAAGRKGAEARRNSSKKNAGTLVGSGSDEEPDFEESNSDRNTERITESEPDLESEPDPDLEVTKEEWGMAYEGAFEV